MSENLTVYGRASSSNVQLVMWAAAELGLSPERLDYGFTYASLDTPEFRALNPFGKIPVLQDGDGPPIFESMAIARYLASAYGDGGAFWPADPAKRAQVDKWADWAKTTIAFGFTGPIFWKVWRTAPADQDLDQIARSVSDYTHHLRQLDAQLQAHDYICGDDLTLADIAAGHVLYRYHAIDIARPELPSLRAYYDRLCAREAYQTHVMVSFDELRVV